mgnify:CR=1 FL=1
MRVLITGTDGYIGCLMAPHIAAAGHDVVGLDTGYFRDAQLGAEPFSAFRTITKDVRLVTRDDLDGIVRHALEWEDRLSRLKRNAPEMART